MSCPHASTNTLLWLYEGPAEPISPAAASEDSNMLAHIAACEECQGVVAEHSDLMATLGPILPALAPAVPTTSHRVRYATWGGASLALVALAASWLLAIPSNLDVRDTGLTPEVAGSTAFATDFWTDDHFDKDLDALDRELRDLSMDLLTL